MCQKCLAKIAAAALGAKIEEVPVGTATKEAIQAVEAAKAELAAVKKEMHAFVDEEAKRVTQRMEVLFKERYDAAEDKKVVAFNAALASAGIDIHKKAGDYTLHHDTGEVTIERIVKAEAPAAEKSDALIAEGVH